MASSSTEANARHNSHIHIVCVWRRPPGCVLLARGACARAPLRVEALVTAHTPRTAHTPATTPRLLMRPENLGSNTRVKLSTQHGAPAFESRIKTIGHDP